MSNIISLPFLSIFLMIAGAALPMINPITPRLNSDLLAFLGLGVFGWFTHLRLPRENRSFGFNGLSLLCGFWLVLACAQYALKINTAYFSHFLISVSYLMAVILLTAWVRLWVQADKGVELAQALMLVVLTAGLLTAGGIALQMLGWQGFLSPWLHKSVSFPRHGGFLSQPNLAASLMVCALVCLMFWHPAQADKAAPPALWRVASMAFLLFAITGTSSRTGYLEVLAVGLLLLWMRKRLAISWVWVAVPLWLLVAIGLGEILSSQNLVSAQMVGDSAQAVTQSSAHRLRIWQDIGTMIESAPWLGVGWRRLQVSEVLMPGIAEPVDHAHNLLLQIQVELGILGSLALVVFGAHWVFKLKPWQFTRAHEVVMLAIAMSLGIHSMLEYPLWHALFLFLFAFALALLPGVGRSYACPPLMTNGMASAILVLTVWVFADYSMSQRAFEQFSKDGSQGGYVAANERVWWNKIFLHSIFMVRTPVNNDTIDVVRKIATENANIYSQTNFHNVPLLTVMIADGETAIANQLAWRLCRQLQEPQWNYLLASFLESPLPAQRAWVEQLPDRGQCRS
jgi:O-antigen ligase